MISLCQVFDETCDWQHRVAAAQLLDRLPGTHFQTTLASLGGRFRREVKPFPKRITPIPRIGPGSLLAAPMLSRWLSQCSADIVHAWGPKAGAAAAFASDRPLVIELFDPAQAARDAKRWRAIARRDAFAVICSSQTVRRRLVEHGVPAESCVTIRPAVDFPQIQKVKKSGLRAALGLADGDSVLFLAPGSTQRVARLAAFWAGALLNHLDGSYRVIVPNGDDSADQIERFAAALPTSRTLVRAPAEVPIEDLIAVSDALLAPDPGDVPTTAIAWAFAAGAAVIAAAGVATTELVVSRINGLLYKHPTDTSPALRIVPLLRDREGQRKVREAARGQAYEVFSLRRFIDQHVLVYENLRAGRPPGEGVVDPAAVAG